MSVSDESINVQVVNQKESENQDSQSDCREECCVVAVPRKIDKWKKWTIYAVIYTLFLVYILCFGYLMTQFLHN